MPKRNPIEQLNEAVETIMAKPEAPLPRIDRSLAALLRIAADLRDLPSDAFRSRLKDELASMRPEPAESTTACAAIPCLVIRNAGHAIDFYKKAFGATELMRFADSSGHIAHAEISIAGAPIAIADEAPEWGNLSPQTLGGSAVIIELQVADVDALASQAVNAGARVIFPVADQFYGKRSGRLADPFGHVWIVSTHKEDVSLEEMERRGAEWEQSEHAEETRRAAAARPAVESSYKAEPHVLVPSASDFIGFAKRAFGAEETARHVTPDGIVEHAEIRIGESVLSAGDTGDEREPMPTAIHLYVRDADAVYKRAVRAGATSMQEPSDQEYGDREAGVKDPFGNHWYIGTHKSDFPSEEPRKRGKKRAPRKTDVSYIPKGLGSMTAYLHPHGTDKVIDFLKRAFEAEEMIRVQPPGDVVHHAKIRIGQSVVELGEAHAPYGPMPTMFHLYVDDTDSVYRRALGAGGVSLSEPADQRWGSRNAGVSDPGGNQWWINAPRKEAAKPSAGPAVKPVPEGYHTATPYLLVEEAPKLMDFLKKAFGATEVMRTGDAHGHFHGEMKIDDSIVMLGNAGRSYPSEAVMPAAIYLYVEDVDAMYKRALKAGATSLTAPKDKDYGDRSAGVKDPFGNVWYIATHVKDVAH